MNYDNDIKKLVAKAEASENLKCPYGLQFPHWIRCKGCEFFYERYELHNKYYRCLKEDIRNYVYYQIEKGEEK